MPKVEDKMRKFIVSASVEDNIRYIAELMKEKKVGSVLIKEGNQYVGIITERDILYKVVAEGKDPIKTKAKEIMSSPLITIEKDKDISEAIKIFKEKNIRRLPVRDGNEIIGILTLRTLIGDLKPGEEITQEIEEIKGLVCAFCGSIFTNEKELSKHIDRVHIGAGILEERR
jgi:CBS domain-containing protein